jgi:predicted glycosyltransferase
MLREGVPDTEVMPFGAPSVMLYSHDTYGLGHLRRTLALAHFFRSQRPFTQLIVTGSPLAHRFPLPRGADYIKLPSVVKVAAGTYESRSLSLPFRSVLDLRRDILLGAARHFRPRVLVVDNVPGGLKGELVPTLRFLKSISGRLVLGLRDVIDDAERVRSMWAKDGSYRLLDEAYDRILVYGVQDVFDPVAEYGFSARAADKTRFTGYIGREPATRDPEQIRAALGVGTERLVLVMAGGGQDGYELLRMCLEAARLRRKGSSFELLLVGGPLLPEDHAHQVRTLARKRSTHYIDFLEDVTSYVHAADAVVSMGGYNSVCELLSLEKPALIVPRISPRKEQLIRAQELGRRGCLRMLHPADITPRRMVTEIERLLNERPLRSKVPMTGLPEAVDVLDELLADVADRAPLAAARGRVG